MAGHGITRRDMLRVGGLVLAGVAATTTLGGCGQSAAPGSAGGTSSQGAGSQAATSQGSESANADAAFRIVEIEKGGDVWKRIEHKSYKDDCTVPLSDLRYLHALHVDLEGNVHEGEMVCNKAIAEDVLDILRKLYEAKYPIERMRLVDDYDADDETSMRDNNSSSFNFRFISHTTKVSKHGYGLAVDINTLYNPYVKEVDGVTYIEPETGAPYVDRSTDFPYKIDHDDLCYKLFVEHGFEWGGDWTDRKDYQHFELPTSAVEVLYPQ